MRCNRCAVDLTKPLRCARCHRVAYCSKQCQASDWKAGHKAACSKASKPSLPSTPLQPSSWASGMQFVRLSAFRQPDDCREAAHPWQAIDEGVVPLVRPGDAAEDAPLLRALPPLWGLLPDDPIVTVFESQLAVITDRAAPRTAATKNAYASRLTGTVLHGPVFFALAGRVPVPPGQSIHGARPLPAVSGASTGAHELYQFDAEL